MTDLQHILLDLLKKHHLEPEYAAAPNKLRFARDLVRVELQRNTALLCNMLDNVEALRRVGYQIDNGPALTAGELDLIARLPVDEVVGVRKTEVNE